MSQCRNVVMHVLRYYCPVSILIVRSSTPPSSLLARRSEYQYFTICYHVVHMQLLYQLVVRRTNDTAMHALALVLVLATSKTIIQYYTIDYSSIASPSSQYQYLVLSTQYSINISSTIVVLLDTIGHHHSSLYIFTLLSTVLILNTMMIACFILILVVLLHRVVGSTSLAPHSNTSTRYSTHLLTTI